MHRTITAWLTGAIALASLPAQAYPIDQYLQIRRASSGVFTPDGRDVVFSSAITGVPQLWRVPRQGGWPEQLTFFEDSVRGASRSPKGDWLLFSKDSKGDERRQLYLMPSAGSRTIPLTNNPKAIHSFGGWSPDGTKIAFASNERNAAYFDLYVMSIVDRQATRVLTHDGTNYALGWSTDGKGLLFTRMQTPSNEDLHLLDVQTGKSRHLTPHQGDATYSYPSFGKDGKVYLLSDQGREFAGLASMDTRTGALRFLTPDSYEVEALQLNEARDRMAYLVNRDGYSELFLQGLEGKPERVSGLPKGVLSDLDWSPDGKQLAFTFSGPSHTADVWVYEVASRQARQLTHSTLAGIPRSSFVSPSLVRYASFDGRQIPAFFYLPKGVQKDGSLPAIVYVHGGPESQDRPDFAPTFQYYLSRGYAILALNIRGSTGYGRTYTHLDDARKRKDAIRDVEYAVRHLRESGYVDGRKIAIMGGSYGGYMTLAALTMLPELWAAGVDSVGMSNLVSFLENTGPWRRPLREAEYGSLAHDRDFLTEVSPINHVDKIKAPLMVIQGANDPRVPQSEADQIVEVLRARQHPVEYQLFMDEGHGIAKLVNRIKSVTTTAEFLDRHVKNRK